MMDFTYALVCHMPMGSRRRYKIRSLCPGEVMALWAKPLCIAKTKTLIFFAEEFEVEIAANSELKHSNEVLVPQMKTATAPMARLGHLQSLKGLFNTLNKRMAAVRGFFWDLVFKKSSSPK
jgi:hypothetical protein